MKVSVAEHAVDGADPVADDLEQVLVALGDHLGQDVVAAGGDHDVVDLVELGQRVGHRLDRAVTRTPTMAWRAKPSSIGSVTATTCITPDSVSRWTRCRTAASDSPTTLPIAA